MWIDKNAYNENVDKEVLFDSLFQCVKSITLKNRLFPNWSDYEPFSLYAATRLYLRLVNPKQFMLDDNGNPKMKRVSSILNFIKKTLSPMIVDFQKNDFDEEFSVEVQGEQFIANLKNRVLDKARSQFADKIRVECNHYFSSLYSVIHEVVDKLPYQTDKVTNHRIYMSCLLTLLNQLTISNHAKQLVRERLVKNLKVDNFIADLYRDELKESIILYHLDDGMLNYISTIVNFIRHYIKKDLKQIIGDNQPTQAVMQAIINDQMERSSSIEGVQLC